MNIKTITEIDNFDDYNYNFQTDLTNKLDEFDWDFNQEIINEIVLWKVNRYSKVDNETISLINKISKDDFYINLEIVKKLMLNLLNTKWIKLPIASTILRFKNPSIFQIIDQRVYRIIYWKKFNVIWLNNEELIELYFKYLKDLKEICVKYWIDFTNSDRILYALDKKFNRSQKIDY